MKHSSVVINLLDNVETEVSDLALGLASDVTENEDINQS